MFKKYFFLFLFSSILVSCASGPRYASIKETIPKLDEDMARIYFYRTSHFGGAYQPSIYINKEAYGKTYLSAVFFKDVTPGSYRITTGMSQGASVELDLSAGDSAYIKTYYRIGFAVLPKKVDPDVGNQEIQNMAYIADPINYKQSE